MPVHYEHGDIFRSPAQTIVNTINTKGVMGKGLALEFKQRFPEMYKDYRERCQRGEVRVGEPYLYRETQPWIVNFPTKDHWRRPSRLEWIQNGLQKFVQQYQNWGIRSVAFPRLGTDLGGLPWDQVRPIMHEALENLGIDVWIYSYSSKQEAASKPVTSSSISPETSAAAGVNAEGLSLAWLNQAPLRELQLRLSLKPSVATAVVAQRSALGGFRRLEDLQQVKGLGRRSKAYQHAAAVFASAQMQLPLL